MASSLALASKIFRQDGRCHRVIAIDLSAAVSLHYASSRRPCRRQEDVLLKIWGREDSLSVQKVMWCIRELGIPYEQINLGKGYESPNQPWYLKMNPTGTIPTID